MSYDQIHLHILHVFCILACIYPKSYTYLMDHASCCHWSSIIYKNSHELVDKEIFVNEKKWSCSPLSWPWWLYVSYIVMGHSIFFFWWCKEKIEYYWHFFFGCLWPAAGLLTKTRVDHLLHVFLPDPFSKLSTQKCPIFSVVIFFFLMGCVTFYKACTLCSNGSQHHWSL